MICPRCAAVVELVYGTVTVYRCTACGRLSVTDTGCRPRVPTVAEARTLYETPAVRAALGFVRAEADRRANRWAKAVIANACDLKRQQRAAQDHEAAVRWGR